MSRSTIFESFREMLDKDKINLKQQLFLEKYVEKYYKKEDIIDRLLIYHGIGTGKTRTSIIIAEKIMKLNAKMKAIIILPARLKTNYIDELIPIICDKYKKELKKYNDPKITDENKKKLLKFFDGIISKNYSIYSYEYIINLFKKSSNIKKTLEEITKNKILIVDEFHNLISNGIKDNIIDDINKYNKLPANPKLIRALIMRYISRYADKSCKMFFLTATPVFDNYLQFIELVKLLNVNPIDDKNLKSFKSIIPYIRGKVSYYSINDKNDFPSVEVIAEKVPLSTEQDKIMFKFQDDDNSEDNETFLLKQRQLAISVYGFDEVKKVIGNLKKYAPKLEVLFTYISNKNNGKHLIYSNFINYCLHIIKYYLDNNDGWVNYLDPKSSNSYKPYKTYILWDATLSDTDKQIVKSVLNSKENIDGKIIKVILGSPSVKEGISFKHIQHLHQIDPVWNISSKQQIEGRCIRYKSHEDIPLKHKYLKRTVIIHNYISVPIKGGLIKKTGDQIIYDDIMPKKEIVINKILIILQKIAIDYYLYRKLSSSPKSSDISISSDNIIKKKSTRIKGVPNTCPVNRRPINNKCEKEGYIIKLNRQKFECCYKELKKKEKKEKKKIIKNSSSKSLSSSSKIEINGYLSKRINAYKEFMQNRENLKKCNNDDNINNLKLVDRSSRLWVIFNANVKAIPVSITLSIFDTNELLMKTIKDLSLSVLNGNTPHFQLYYMDIRCNVDNIEKYNKLLSDNYDKSKLPAMYNIKFYENLFYYCNLNEFIEKNNLNINDRLFVNAFSQCMLSIIYYYSYMSSKYDEIMGLNGISGEDFICHKIEKGGYFKYEIYGKEYYIENLGYVFILSFLNRKSDIIKLDTKDNYKLINSFITTINLFIYMITQYFSKQSNHNFMHKLGNALDECNNKNKQLPNKIIAKTINSIAAYIIIEDNLVLYKGLIKRISKDVINPNSPYLINIKYS
jgi:hypothetical protein